MYSCNNLLIPADDFFTPFNDAQTDDQTHPGTQPPSGSTQPPGAEIAGPPTSSRLRQAEHPVNRRGHWLGSTPFSADCQNDNSATSFDALSPPDSIPPSPHVFDLRASFYGYADRIAMPGTQGNRPLTHMSKHSRHLSQPSIISSQAVARGGRRASVGVGSYASVPQPTPAIFRVASGSAPVIPLTMSSTPAQRLPPDQIPGLIHSSFPRRSSEPDSFCARNKQRVFLAPYAPENQPTPATYTPFFGQPCFSQASSSAQYPTAASAHMVPELSSHTQDDLWAIWDSDASFAPSCTSDLQDDSTSVISFTESASPGVPSEFVDDTLPQQGISSAAPQPQSPRTQHRTRKRKRVTQPKHRRETQRYQRQRQKDDENLMDLSKLFVPDSVEAILKDPLGTILFYARKKVGNQDDPEQQISDLAGRPHIDIGPSHRQSLTSLG
ncbi:hypothetical protein BJV74DRAFT_843487 [Russula compacta]|nr:hypothetical protein BJV74DRAFT_843487 [Russula compacta]